MRNEKISIDPVRNQGEVDFFGSKTAENSFFLTVSSTEPPRPTIVTHSDFDDMTRIRKSNFLRKDCRLRRPGRCSPFDRPNQPSGFRAAGCSCAFVDSSDKSSGYHRVKC